MGAREVNDNPLRLRGVFYGIGDQVDQHLSKSIFVAHYLALRFSLDGDVMLRGCLLQVLSNLADERVNVNGFFCKLKSPRLNLREVEQISNQFGELVDLRRHFGKIKQR